MIYLDTGCLLKLYYPEPESAAVAKFAAGQAIVWTALHELETSNALELKLFRKEAKPGQVQAIKDLLELDLRAGTLYRPAVAWHDVLLESAVLARAHTRKIGCRSLDILHCAAARALSMTSFLTTDTRQRRLASALGLSCPAI